MNPTVYVSLANPDPNANPTNLQGLVDTLNPLFQSSLTGTFTPPVISSTTPAVSDQDKAWYKIDGNGRPLGIFIFYNGNWRKFYTGNTQELRMFRGNPATFFDNTGLGLIGLDWDGWAICNGQNGTDNWSDQFLVFGRMDNTPITGYNSGWQTNVTGGATKTGGASNYLVKNTDLPNMEIHVTGRKYDGNGTGGSPPVKHAIVTDNWSNVTDFTDPNPIATFGATPPGNPQTTIPTIPPYRVTCVTQFVGYN